VMANLTSIDTTYDDGANFTFSTLLPLGQDHSFHVEFADDKFTVRNPVGSELPGPVVYNERPRAMVLSPSVPELTVYDDVILRSGSVDFDGDPLNESWESNVDGKLGTGRELKVRLTNATHLITLYVDDEHGGRNQTGVVLNVRQPFPVLEIGTINATPRKPIELDAVGLVATAANTGDGDATDVNVTWKINGKVLDRKVEPRIAAFSPYTSNITWTPENPGRYTVTFEVGTLWVDLPIEVIANLPPLVEAGPDVNLTLGPAGATVLFNGSVTSDTDGEIVGILWDFGDGNTSTDALPSHTYPLAGTYTVKLTVTDNKGASSSDTLVVTIVLPPKKKVPPITGSMNGLLLLLLLAAVVATALLVWRRQQQRANARIDSASPPVGGGQPYASDPSLQGPPGGTWPSAPPGPSSPTQPAPGTPYPPDDGMQGRTRPPQW